ncbi:Bicarbonate transporter, eukaryotic [Ophiocordyceps sinensis CO18]|nr:Bicarbonate transporter, eukaryotic [Ophiocordyceps sinensis CO18]
MTGPLLVVIHLIPHGVLAGLFFVMGVQALEANGITAKLLFLGRDKGLTAANHPLRAVKRRAAVWLFVAMELIGFGATFAITQTVAAVGFPVFILALIPIRALLLPMALRPEELALLDAPTASDFTMEGIGGTWGKDAGTGNDTAGPSRSPSCRESQRFRGGDGDLAGTSNPRKAQEDLAELGQAQSGSGATRRRERG